MTPPTLWDMQPAAAAAPADGPRAVGVARAVRDRRPIEQRFAEFDAQHPEVYRLFVELAVRLLKAGHAHGSADQIIQRIRWESMVNPNRDGGWKINDQFSALYSRKLAAEDARFRHFFEFRQRRAG